MEGTIGILLKTEIVEPNQLGTELDECKRSVSKYLGVNISLPPYVIRGRLVAKIHLKEKSDSRAKVFG